MGVDVIINPTDGVIPHHERFRLQYEYLKNTNEEYVVATDTRDVIFQLNPIQWLKNNLGNHQIVCSSEGICYEKEFWGNSNLKEGYPYLYDFYKNNRIMNVGVLGGKTKAIADLCLLIYTMCKHNPAKVSDQSSFNVLCGMNMFDNIILKTDSSFGWSLHAGTLCRTVNFDKFEGNLVEPLPKIENGIAKTYDGKTYCIYHQYDRVL
jgi:hypothetical protein